MKTKYKSYLDSFGLVNGCIPKGTVCQLKQDCKPKQCHHLGKSHPNDFNCGSARFISMIKLVKEV